MKHPRLIVALITVALAAVFISAALRAWDASLNRVVTPAVIERAIARAVLTEVATRTLHGSRDDLTPLHELSARLNAGNQLMLTCGYVSALAKSLLANAGIEARRVFFLTKAPFDGNNGHTALELNIGGVWYFADPDFGRFYEQPARTLIDGRGGWVAIGEQYADPEDAAIYPRHIDNGVTGIEDGAQVYFDCEDQRQELVSHVEGYAPNVYVCLSSADFLTRFYA